MIEIKQRLPENTNLSLNLFFNSKKSAFIFQMHTSGPTPPGFYQKIKPEGRALTRKSCPTPGVPGGGDGKPENWTMHNHYYEPYHV